MNLTEKELAVVRAFAINEYSDSFEDGTWMFTIKEYSELNGKTFSGVCASLDKKGLVYSDTEGDKGMVGVKLEDTYSMGLTNEGIKVFKQYFDEEGNSILNKTNKTMKSSDVELIKSLVKGQSFKINGVEYVFIKNVDADSIIAGNRDTQKQEEINLTFLINKNSKTMTNVNEVSVEELVQIMNVKDLRIEAKKFSIVGYSKMNKVTLQEKVIAEIEAAKPKTEEEKIKQVIVNLAEEIGTAVAEKKKATESDSIMFHQSIINDLKEGLKAAKTKLNELLNPVVEVEKKKTSSNKPSKTQITKDKKAAKSAAKENKKKLDAEANKSKKDAKVKNEAKAKKAKGLTMTEEVDKLVAKGGKWKNLCAFAQEKADARGLKTKYTKGTFTSQIKYREGQSAGWLKGLKMKVTDNGIEKIK